MREWCSCGSSIRASRRDVITWRATHLHEGRPEPEPDKNGAESRVEHAGDRYYETSPAWSERPIVQARIGFQTNE